MKSFFSWIGGKSRLSKILVERISRIEHNCYVEPFMGAAHVFFRKEPKKTEVLNDINSELPNLFRVLQRHPGEFFRRFHYSVASREEFYRPKNQDPATLTDIQRAARFYYLQKLCFGGARPPPVLWGLNHFSSSSQSTKTRKRNLSRAQKIG